MKVSKKVTKIEQEEVSAKELVAEVLQGDGYYILSEDNDDDMFETFVDCYDGIIDPEDLRANREEILDILKHEQLLYNENNYEDCVQEAADFIVDAFSDGFWDSCDNIVYGEARSTLFGDAIKLLYKQICDEEPEIE